MLWQKKLTHISSVIFLSSILVGSQDFLRTYNSIFSCFRCAFSKEFHEHSKNHSEALISSLRPHLSPTFQVRLSWKNVIPIERLLTWLWTFWSGLCKVSKNHFHSDVLLKGISFVSTPNPNLLIGLEIHRGFLKIFFMKRDKRSNNRRLLTWLWIFWSGLCKVSKNHFHSDVFLKEITFVSTPNPNLLVVLEIYQGFLKISFWRETKGRNKPGHVSEWFLSFLLETPNMIGITSNALLCIRWQYITSAIIK